MSLPLEGRRHAIRRSPIWGELILWNNIWYKYPTTRILIYLHWRLVFVPLHTISRMTTYLLCWTSFSYILMPITVLYLSPLPTFSASCEPYFVSFCTRVMNGQPRRKLHCLSGLWKPNKHFSFRRSRSLLFLRDRKISESITFLVLNPFCSASTIY